MPLPAHAAATPDALAIIMDGTGETVSYAQLDERSRRISTWLRSAGLGVGDRVAVVMENSPRFLELYWGVVRSGMYFCPVNRHLTASEAAYIVNDSGARVLVTSAGVQELAQPLADLVPDCPHRLVIDGTVPGYLPFEAVTRDASAEPVEAPLGDFMNYSSGTTGRPKGIKRPLSGQMFGEVTLQEAMLGGVFGMGPDTVYLSPAPLYHTAPLAYTTAVHGLGGTVVVMERFEPRRALELIEAHRVTHSQWVPTMFVRLLQLPQSDRLAHDLSSHKVAIHAAAPCPRQIKQQMIDWWGPIVVEYYGATEGNGVTMISSEEWLAHPGSVGRPLLGVPHVCDPEGNELGVGEIGAIYFERDQLPFEYHGDEAKTSAARHPEHPTWTKLGDIGYLDDDGYLYLTDREAFTIISGGVNIYPQEIEDCLIVHPKVADVAVIGVPSDDLGEEVKAIIQPAEGVEPDEGLTKELLAHVSAHLARYKVPRSVDYDRELPRLDTGKLYKQALRARYLPDPAGR